MCNLNRLINFCKFLGIDDSSSIQKHIVKRLCVEKGDGIFDDVQII